jgi:hypothetical protein
MAKSWPSCGVSSIVKPRSKSHEYVPGTRF